MYELTERLWVSGHLMHCKDVKGLLKRKHIDVVVSTVWPRMEEQLGLWEYIWEPVEDAKLTGNELRALERVASKVATHIKSGRRVLIHCHMGRNRSCFVAGMVMIKLKQMGAKEVIKHIRKKRLRALSNKHFVQHLKTYGNNH
jgi:protein-tyrosine phosphatase